VVLSDHGQSQGATFRQRYGESLEEVVERLSPSPFPLDEGEEKESFPETPVDPLLVVSSGNLSLLYLTRYRRRLDRAEIERVYPQLIDGLATHPGIGLVVVNDDDGPVAIGAAGRHHLRDGAVQGIDPLLPYGPYARHDLLRHQESAHVGDLVLISSVDPVTDEVAAFEELVGSHGGLGGWQTEAVLVHPKRWPLTEPELDGADSVHRQLVSWLDMLGLRRSAPATPLEAGEPIHAPAPRLSRSRDG
jgi:hypothetical protein